jgi:hypothetical protein
MPNWVTNNIQAPSHVIQAILNDEGDVDFNTVAPFPGPNDNWGGISMGAETAAQAACNAPLSDSPVLAALEADSRRRVDIKELTDSCFEQFIGMLQNYRACGYFHSMHFAREVWGTKWNAYRPWAKPDEGRCGFDTAWACPEGVLVKLSERFPEDTITVIYADEDIGANCGTFVLKGGVVIEQDIAPHPREMEPDVREKWTRFACDVKGFDPEEFFEE